MYPLTLTAANPLAVAFAAERATGACARGGSVTGVPTPATTHDEQVSALRAAVRAVTLEAVANAFLASLGSAPSAARAALAHYAYAANLPAHSFQPTPGAQSYLCIVCGNDLDVPLAELQTFASLPAVKPTADDVAIFDAMLGEIAALPATARATDLAKRWKLPRSNRHARMSLVETLGACGLLETLDHPGRLTRWVGFWEHEEIPALSGDLRPPAAWWRGDDGVNRAALDLVFPHRGIKRARFPKRRAWRAIQTGPSERGFDMGDLVGITYQGRTLRGIVVGRHVVDAKRAIPVVEFFAGDSKTLRHVGPYRDAPTWRREPLALDGLKHYGTTMPVTLARLGKARVPRPAATGYRVVTARNLLYILRTLMT